MMPGNGFSLIEILIGVLILAIAVIPIFSISTTTTRSAHLVGRHLAAAQIAQSILEYFVGKPYREALQEARDLQDRTIPVPEDLIFQNILQGANPSENQRIMAQFRHTFNLMEYSVEVSEEDEPKHGPVARFRVILSYRLVEEQSATQQTIACALKFPEDV
jgi:prepilin-type N-terminal cleavage/methylation domain-containing protein